MKSYNFKYQGRSRSLIFKYSTSLKDILNRNSVMGSFKSVLLMNACKKWFIRNEPNIGVRPCVQLRYIVRWVEAPSNKLLTTAFEASLESVTVTCRLSVDSKIAGIAMEHRNPKVSEGRHRGQGGRQYMHLSFMVRFLHASAVLLKLFMSDRDYMSTGEDLHFLFRVCKWKVCPPTKKKKDKRSAGSRRPEQYRWRYEQNKYWREVERELCLAVLACETISKRKH